jgi:hypothetical protein
MEDATANPATDTDTDTTDVTPSMPTTPTATITPIAGDNAKPKAKVKELTATEREV